MYSSEATTNLHISDIIGDLSFAESFHNLELRRPHPWLKNVFGPIRTGVKVQALMTLPYGEKLVSFLMRQLQRKMGFEFFAFARDKVDARIAQGTTRPDFMSRVLENNRDDGTGITRGEINATTIILVIAGSETTATLLSGAMNLLMRNPAVLRRVRGEVD
jgi:cytochrome P450